MRLRGGESLSQVLLQGVEACALGPKPLGLSVRTLQRRGPRSPSAGRHHPLCPRGAEHHGLSPVGRRRPSTNYCHHSVTGELAAGSSVFAFQRAPLIRVSKGASFLLGRLQALSAPANLGRGGSPQTPKGSQIQICVVSLLLLVCLKGERNKTDKGGKSGVCTKEESH